MFYKITLTTSGGLVQSQLDEFKSYFSECFHAFLVVEYGSTGSNCHLEGVVEYKTVKTNNVTVRIKNLYKRCGIEVSHNSINVQKAHHLNGALLYANKELETKGHILVQEGWTSSFIDQVVKSAVRKKTNADLMKGFTRVTQSHGGPLMYEWATANNMKVINKQSYLDVKKQMASEGYLFGTCRDQGLYQDVCACFGDGNAAYDVGDGNLHFV